jgi:hypothetical protein
MLLLPIAACFTEEELALKKQRHYTLGMVSAVDTTKVTITLPGVTPGDTPTPLGQLKGGMLCPGRIHIIHLVLIATSTAAPYYQSLLLKQLRSSSSSSSSRAGRKDCTKRR